MNRDEFDDEIEELEDSEDIIDTTEANDSEELQEEYPEYSKKESSSKPKFGEKEYNAARDEKGHYDKNYYAKKEKELDDKVKKAKDEKNNTEAKNKRDKVKDNINLERAKLDRVQNKMSNIKAKTYQTLHPIESTKDIVESKAKETTQKVAKKATEKAFKTTGRLVASGAKAVISFLASNPIVIGVLIIVLILFILIALLFSTSEEEELAGYFDNSCDYNLTSIVTKCEVAPEMSLKDYIINVAYAESEERHFSEAAIKALMIILKTNVLANGNYDSSGDKVIEVNEKKACIQDNNAEIDKSKSDQLQKYYNDIVNFLFVSTSYNSTITDLGSADVLEYNDTILNRLASSSSSSYEEILKELYPNVLDNEEDVTVNDSKPFIFVGDSRTVGMKISVSELNDSNTVAEGSKGYSWFVESAINSINSKMSRGTSYNIISWLGVNDLGGTPTTVAEKYFNKYKELAESTWKNHTIYVVKVGPVIDSRTYFVDNAPINTFNSEISRLISGANISNLKYINLNYSISYYDDEGLHYGTSDYQKIYDSIMAGLSSSKTINKNRKLYNLSEYCAYYDYNSSCNVGWWYPIGSAEPTSGNIYGGEPMAPIDYEDSFCLTPGCRPGVGVTDYHTGNDLYASIGDHVIATRAGTVIVASDAGCVNHNDCGGCICPQNGSGFGNYVAIDHGDGLVSYYGHLSPGTIVVKKGEQVAQGQLLGNAGSSGSSTGPHLHFEMRLYGQAVDPYNYVDPYNPRPTGDCSTNQNYSDDQKGVCLALIDLGFSNNAVAGLLANIKYETAQFNFDPKAYVANDNGGPSMGLIMWHDVFACANYNVCSAANSGYICNASALKCYCEQNNMSWDTVACQTAYLKNYIDRYANVYDFDAAKTVYDPSASAYEVATQFCLKLERPANRYSNCPSRASMYASQMLQYVQNGCNE